MEYDINDYVTSALGDLRASLGNLVREAEEISGEHLRFVMAENRRRAFGDQSTLYCKVRQTSNSLSVTWYKCQWYGIKPKRYLRKTTIPKPNRKHIYTIASLESVARSWEIDLVRDIELKLAEIRRQSYHIGKALGTLNIMVSNHGKNAWQKV